MRLYNRYLLALSLLLLISTVLLAWGKENRLDLYFSLYLLEYLGVTVLFAHFNPMAKRLTSSLGYILLLGFLAILVPKVMGVLFGVKIG